MPLRLLLSAALALATLQLSACASIRQHHADVASGRANTALARKVWETPGFLRHHPDIRERKRGFWLDEEGDHAGAAEAFRLAARFADKAAQAMLAEYYREGRGVPRDPAAAYAWMDLAAERGYPLFLARREHYWKALDPVQQQRALALGAALYAEFGDAVAKPRIEEQLRRGRATMTGSRVGSPGAITVILPTAMGWLSVPGGVYYDDRYWRPSEYFAWLDHVHGQWPSGEVTVGALRSEASAPADE